MSSEHGPVGSRHSDTVTLVEVWRAIWRARFLVVVCAIVAMLICGAISFVVPPSYRATVVMVPSESESPGGALGGVVAEFGGLAGLVGLGGGSSNRKTEALAVLQSDALATQYIRDNNLLPVLFADKWDGATNAWKEDLKSPPTLWQATRRFARYRAVADDAKTGVIQLVIRWNDPIIAAQWANDLVALTNEHLREEAVRTSQNNISYLNSEAEKSGVVEVRTSIYALLQQEMRALMLAKGSEAYALKVLDPAVPPEDSTTPGLLIWLIAGALGGGAIGMFVALLIFGFRR